MSFTADLTSEQLEIDELSGFIGGQPGAPDPDPDRLIPVQPLDLERLRAANGEAHLVARAIRAGGWPIEDLDARFSLKDGVLRAAPARFGVAGGELTLQVAMHGDQDPAAVEIASALRGVQIAQAFRGIPFMEEMGGRLDGRIRLAGRGNSLHEVLGGADGEAFLVTSDGTVSGLIVEMIGLDVAESLGLFFAEGDAPIPVRCLVADLAVETGVIRPRTLVLDTDDTVIEGTGEIALDKERLSLQITPHPKDISFLSFRSWINVDGSFVAPEVGLDAGSILEFVPPIDWGAAEDVPCQRLIGQAQAEFEDGAAPTDAAPSRK